MVNQVYNAINKYFGHLANTGYMSQDNVNKLLLFDIIYNLLDNDFRALVSEEDYQIINNVLYCLYGSTCLIPFPDYYNSKNNRVMYKGSMSELAHRVAVAEATVNEYGEKPIVVPHTSNTDGYTKDVEDVDESVLPDEDDEV